MKKMPKKELDKIYKEIEDIKEPKLRETWARILVNNWYINKLSLKMKAR